jgi:hypothetical protein
MKAWRELVTKAELSEKRTPSSRGSLGKSDGSLATSFKHGGDGTA